MTGQAEDFDPDAYAAKLARDMAEWDRANPEKAKLRAFLWRRLGLSGAADQTDEEEDEQSHHP